MALAVYGENEGEIVKETTRSETLNKLNELIKEIDFAMLTTQEADGTLRSRPMSTQETESDGDLWFFTSIDTAKVDEMKREKHVNVSYADKSNQRYVSVSGRATVLRDQQKINELWSPALKIWFPNGKDDPNLGLIKVRVTEAEYWDSSANRMVQLLRFAKALVTGDSEDMGENQKLDL